MSMLNYINRKTMHGIGAEDTSNWTPEMVAQQKARTFKKWAIISGMGIGGLGLLYLLFRKGSRR